MHNEDIEAVRRFANYDESTNATTDKQAARALVNRLADLAGASLVGLRCALLTNDPSFDREDAGAVVKAWDYLNQNAPTVAVLTPAIVAEVANLLRAGNKIQAIKKVREVTRWGLKETKDYVEALPVQRADISPLKGGDRVRCPSGMAINEALDGIAGIGQVTEVAENVRVNWPSGYSWWHDPSELVLVIEQAEPNIIAEVRADQNTTTSQDRELVAAVLGNERFRAELLDFDNGELGPARGVVARLLSNQMVFTSHIKTLIDAYDDVMDPQAARKREVRARLEELRRQVRELERDLAA